MIITGMTANTKASHWSLFFIYFFSVAAEFLVDTIISFPEQRGSKKIQFIGTINHRRIITGLKAGRKASHWS